MREKLKILRDILFLIFFCIFIFWEPILFSIVGSNGQETDGGLMRSVLTNIFFVSCFFYLIITPRYVSEIKMILILVLFGGLYYSTQFFYPNASYEILKLYNGQLLRWGSGCVSACLIGMTLMKIKDYSLIHKILPLESIALTPFMVSLILENSISAGQYIDEGGFNYQVLAYYMAVLFCISFYYAFIFKNNNTKTGIIIKIVLMVIMLVQAVACCMAGGRGGIVLLLVYIIYMSFYLVNKKIISIWKLLLGIVISFCGFLYFASVFDMWTSAGFERASGFADDEDRIDMWAEIWHYVSDNAYLPYGLGGDYFTYGFYTHNMLLDFIIEMGVIGLPIMSFIFYLTFIKMYRLAAKNDIFVITMVFFIYGVVMNMFSGYWISQDTTWMAFGISITAINYEQWHPKKSSLLC